MYNRLSKTPSSINTNSQAAEQNPKLGYRPFGSQIHKASVAPVTQTDIEDEAFAEQKFEAIGLELQAKYGKITSEGQERLTVLQAKMDELLNSPLERATRFSHNFANIPIRSRDTATAIQAKLTIGEPGDKYEQEADETARQVVQRIHQPQSDKLQGESLPDEELQMKPMVQRRVSDGGMAATQDLEASINQARGGGQPLAKNIRKPMELGFGADFSRVKVHTDTRADQLNRSIQAKAFTTGQDVFFRQGEYNPSSRGGQELLAHELTHVVQQNGGAVQRSQLLDGGICQRQTGLSSMVQRKSKIKHPARRVGIDLDFLPDNEVEGLIQYLNGDVNAPKFTIEFDNESPDTLLKRANKKLQSRQQVTGKFNVQGRAVDSDEGVVFSDDNEIRNVAQANGLWAYPAENETLVLNTYPQKFVDLFLLIDQPTLANTKFYGKKTAQRGARDKVAAMKGNKTIQYPNSDTVQSTITLTEPCKRGDESKTQQAAMGDLSALNYAKAVGINGAENHTWEWLHLVGSAIGGGNKLGNLVAGTYDMNTLMIPLEQTIVEYSNRKDKNISAKSPMNVTAEAKLFKKDNGQPTWVAETITLKVEHGGESFWLGPITRQINMLTKMEFDFYRYVFQRMAEND